MSYQYSYNSDEKVCGRTALYEPVDPNKWFNKSRNRKAGSDYDIERDYDWDDSYVF